MALSDREHELLAQLSPDKSVSAEALARQLYVSVSTVRRDLAALAGRGLIVRTHGGAMLKNDSAETRMPLYLRANRHSREKRAIAEKAVSLIHNGDVIMLDASSTAAFLVPYLTDFGDIIVITSGVRTAMALSETGIESLCTGGRIINNSFSYIGRDAADMIRHYNADLFFFSCHGLTEDGWLTDTSKEENDLRAEMLRRSRRSVLLADSSKLGVSCWHNLCRVDETDYVVCDAPLPPSCGKPRIGSLVAPVCRSV